MAAVWILVAWVGAGPADARGGSDVRPGPTAGSAAAAPRTGKTLADSVRASLRCGKTVDSARADGAARELLGLLAELQQDRALAATARRSLQTQVRCRLLQLADQIERRAAQQRRDALAANVPAANALAANVPADRAGVLAQQPAVGGRGNAAQARDDYGEELAELIRDVVAPRSWDTAGGNASIRYWRPGRALIIRQTTENHEQIVDVLEQLERMSR